MNIQAKLGVSAIVANGILGAVIGGVAIAAGPIWAARILQHFLRVGWRATVIW